MRMAGVSKTASQDLHSQNTKKLSSGYFCGWIFCSLTQRKSWDTISTVLGLKPKETQEQFSYVPAECNNGKEASELESREGSWLADEERDKSVWSWDGIEQSVNFHCLVLDLFVSFSITQKFHLKTISK